MAIECGNGCGANLPLTRKTIIYQIFEEWIGILPPQPTNVVRALAGAPLVVLQKLRYDDTPLMGMPK